MDYKQKKNHDFFQTIKEGHKYNLQINNRRERDIGYKDPEIKVV